MLRKLDSAKNHVIVTKKEVVANLGIEPRTQ